MSLEKFIVLSHSGKFYIIVHACPSSKNSKFQWYWMDDPNNEVTKNIEGEVYNISNDPNLYDEMWGWDCDSILVLNKEVIKEI